MIGQDVIGMKKWLRWILIALFAGVFLVCGYKLLNYYGESEKQQSQFQALADMVEQERPTIPTATVPPQDTTEPAPTEEPPAPTEHEILQAYAQISQLNGDMVGWLTLEGTKINYPVMQTPDRTGYYLHRDFYGNYSGHGCLFAREICDVNCPSDNVTIYGHNMKDGSMFAPLLDYRSKSFWQNHRYIHFDTLTQYHTYEVFAVFTTTATRGQGFAYHQFVDARDEADFDDYVARCKSLSLYDTGITPVYGEKLITLSTCEYSQANGRFVVVARQIN